MLGEDKINQIEDLTNLEVHKEQEEQRNKNIEEKNTNNIPQINNNIIQEIPNQINQENTINNICPLNPQQNNVPTNPLKKKENPALLPPNPELLKNKANNTFVCCINHSQMPVNYQDKDPKNYQGMPPCMLSSIIPAGKPSHVLAPLNIFANEYTE